MKFMCYIASFLLGIMLLAALTEAAPSEVDSDYEEAPVCLCARNFEPVCAANLVTYANRCLYDCVRRDEERRGRSLEFLREGPCEE
ncbi:serine protease inhibitor Kazal-type 2-like [Zeugodacus cucurbitae]|uniref:serine protease inhibitor Kazal-type 2-like n=1 Tax=Zeugodacus cucurbitae TaxID=28588 RepID=UPI0023D93029|nr:serine protease inhibitor Kazal-type 2-like [Zeugodacus cucurbitae]